MDIDPGAQVISRLTDVYRKRYPQVSLSFDKAYVDRYTGIEIGNDRILSTLTALGFGASYDGKEFHVEVPSWRATKDVTIKADIIEEITRIYGYDNFQVSTTLSPLYPQQRSAANRADNFTKDLLVQRYHLHEVHSYIWFDRKKCKELGIQLEENVSALLSPQSPDHEVLRTNMGPTPIELPAGEQVLLPGLRAFSRSAGCVRGLKEDGSCNERKKLGVALFSRTKKRAGAVLPAAGYAPGPGRGLEAHPVPV